MNNPEIELKKERDFSDVFNASFAFISQEIKRLSKVIVLYAGIPIIIAVILSALYSQDIMTSVFEVMNQQGMMSSPDGGLVFMTILLGFLAQIVIAGLVPAYLGEYEEKGKSGFTADDVWQRFLKNLGPIIGYSILAFLMIVVGFVFLVIPGIYLSVPFAFILYVKIIENRSLGATFSRSFQLIRNNWWKTFGIIILAYLIFAILSGLLSAPAMIVAGIEGFLISSGQQETVNSESLAFVLTTILGGLGQYLLYPVLYVIIAFQYYSLREQKDQDSLMEKVSAINIE